MRMLIAATLSLLAGCSAYSHYKLAPTAPEPVRATSVDLTDQLPEQCRLLVVSPLSLEQVTGRLTQEVPTDATTASPEEGLGHTTDYNVAASAMEAHLLNSGYHVISQAALAQYAEDGGKNGELEAIRAKGNLTLLEAALVLAPAADADAVLLLRSVQAYYEPTPIGWLIHPANGLPIYILEAVAVVDAVLVDSETREVTWSGRTRVKARDLMEQEGSITAHSNGYVDNTEMHYTYLHWHSGNIESGHKDRIFRVEHPEVLNALLEFATGMLAESLNRASGREGIEEGVVEEGLDDGGMDEGSTDGVDEGSTDGMDEGSTDGMDEGSTDGMDEGSTDGMDEGSTDGTDEGSTDGTDEGSTDGTDEGSTDGMDEGSTDGADEGATDQAPSDGATEQGDAGGADQGDAGDGSSAPADGGN